MRKRSSTLTSVAIAKCLPRCRNDSAHPTEPHACVHQDNCIGPGTFSRSEPAEFHVLARPQRTPELMGTRRNLRPLETQAADCDTASVRLVTLMDLNMAVTWFLTVGKARSSVRDIALLLLPFIRSPRTSACRPVRPRSAARRRAV